MNHLWQASLASLREQWCFRIYQFTNATFRFPNGCVSSLKVTYFLTILSSFVTSLYFLSSASTGRKLCHYPPNALKPALSFAWLSAIGSNEVRTCSTEHPSLQCHYLTALPSDGDIPRALDDDYRYHAGVMCQTKYNLRPLYFSKRTLCILRNGYLVRACAGSYLANRYRLS